MKGAWLSAELADKWFARRSKHSPRLFLNEILPQPRAAHLTLNHCCAAWPTSALTSAMPKGSAALAARAEGARARGAGAPARGARGAPARGARGARGRGPAPASPNWLRKCAQ